MGKLNFLQKHLNTLSLSETHSQYLSKRGVDQNSSVKFSTWTPMGFKSPCNRFTHSFGENGFKIKNQIVYPIYSPRDEILGIEAQKREEDGSKRVFQYRTDSSQWNPYFLNSKKAFQSLWDGCDLWIVEGVFDLIALEKAIPPCDTVISTLRAGMDQISMQMISRYFKRPSKIYIAYDNDETGIKKSKWLRNEFLKRNVDCEIWKYRGNDPNEVWSKGGDHALRRMFL